jgi:hypothetical protein
MLIRRPLLIAHLCLVFTVMVWALISPVVNLSLCKREQAATASYLLSDPYGELNSVTRLQIESHSGQLEVLTLSDLGYSWYNGLTGLPIWLKGWLLFSLLLALLLLLQVEGISSAVWLLPLIAAMQLFIARPAYRPTGSIVPSEQTIFEKYIQEPVATRVADQRDQLLRGWESYLIREWADQEPALDLTLRQEQRGVGEWRFHLARLLQVKRPLVEPPQIGPFFYLLLLGWNLLFALLIYMSKTKVCA